MEVLERLSPRVILERKEQSEVDACLAKLARSYRLTPDEVEALREPLEKVADAKLKEFWQKRSAYTAVASVTVSVAAVAIGLAIGSLAPASLGIVGISALLGLGGSMVSVFRRLKSAVDGVAEVELERMGKKEHGHGLLDRLADKLAARILRKFEKKYALDADQMAILKREIDRAEGMKEREFWYGRAKTEVAVAGAVPLLTAGFTLLAGLLTPLGLVSAVAGSIAGAGLTAVLLYKKLEFSVEGSARGVIEAWRKDGELTRPWTPKFLDRVAQARADALVEEYADAYHLDPEAKKVLQREVDLMRATKVKELWQDRPKAAAGMPFAQAAITGAIVGAAGLAKPLVVASLAVTAGLSAIRELVTLDVTLTHALEGTAYATAKRLAAGAEAA